MLVAFALGVLLHLGVHVILQEHTERVRSFHKVSRRFDSEFINSSAGRPLPSDYAMILKTELGQRTLE